MVHYGMNEHKLQLEEYIDSISLQLTEYTTPTFTKLSGIKKKNIVLAICQEASSISNPTEVNIKEVAKRGKIAVGSLYKYFINRENMINYIINLIREYILAGMEYSLQELLKYPINEALYYYCMGSEVWSKEENILTYFFYQSAYCGSNRLTKELVHPAALSFEKTVKRILENAIKKEGLTLNNSIDHCSAFVHRSLLSIADSLIYKNLQDYYFPAGFSKDNITAYIDTIINGITYTGANI